MAAQQQTISININQLFIAFVAAMAIACAFIAFIINTAVSSKINALDIQQAASATASPQTNNAPEACVGVAAPATQAAAGGTAGTVNGSNLATVKYLPSNVTYNQSNSQTTISTSTNTYTDNRWSGNSSSVTRNLTNIQAWNNGNTTNSGNSLSTSTTTTTTTNTVNDNSNHSVNTVVSNNGNSLTDNRNSGNTTSSSSSTTTNTVNDNSNNSVNTNIQDNGNTSNSGNSSTTNTSTSMTTNTVNAAAFGSVVNP